MGKGINPTGDNFRNTDPWPFNRQNAPCAGSLFYLYPRSPPVFVSLLSPPLLDPGLEAIFIASASEASAACGRSLETLASIVRASVGREGADMDAREGRVQAGPVSSLKRARRSSLAVGADGRRAAVGAQRLFER